MDVSYIELDDHENYILLSKTDIKGIIYYLLVKEKNKYEYVIRKEVNDMLIGLDNEKELSKVILKFAEDNKDNQMIKKHLETMLKG